VVKARMEFRLLGPLEVAEDGRLIPLGGSRARALLALLLLHRNEVVPVDRIVDELWGGQPPKTAGQVVRVYVSQLRKSLEPGRSDGPPQVLVTQGSGYALKVDRGEVDVERFDELRTEGRRLLDAGEAAQAADALGEALTLWRGTPLQDFAYEAFAHSEIMRLEELRLATLEDLFDAQLAAGRDSELVADLEQLVETNPLRERLRWQLMLALYRSGRQADALETYQRGRRLLVDELGLEPSETLRQLETQILQHDSGLDRPSAPEAPAGAKTRSRRATRLGVAAALFGIAAIAGLLIAATTDSGRRRPSTASLRVALVDPGQRDATSADPLATEPINGLRAAAEQFGFRPKILYGGDGDAFLQKIKVAARTNQLVIVGPTPATELDALSELTRSFPGTRFLVPDSVHDPYAHFARQPNVTGVNFHDYENGELGGYFAALMTHGRQVVSAVGGEPTQSVQNLINGFKAGAARARPHIRVRVRYTGSFEDQSLCAAAAERQLNNGSKVIFDAAGDCGFGVLTAVADDGSAWALAVDSNPSNITDRILGAVVKNVGFETRRVVTLFAAGQLPGGHDLQFDFANRGIALVGIRKGVPQSVKRKLVVFQGKLESHDKAR
jgi:DNA-binding SARP family transcriptional activator/basic membrane lipoprotein Med (substrate-binding protein (PBP1-ABC) superfamily)